MSETDITELRSRGAVVSLEGPAPIAGAAEKVEDAAQHTLEVARAVLGSAAEWAPSGGELMQPNWELRQTIQAFTVAARDHLNTRE